MNKHGIRNKFSPRVAVIAMSADDGRTQQHFGDKVDINKILAKYRKTGVIEHVQRAQERYGDFTELTEFAIHADKVAKANQAFEMLPAELRNKFNNSVPGFFEFIGNPANKDECIKWGLFNKPAESGPIGDPDGVAKAAASKKSKANPQPTDKKEE